MTPTRIWGQPTRSAASRWDLQASSGRTAGQLASYKGYFMELLHLPGEREKKGPDSGELYHVIHVLNYKLNIPELSKLLGGSSHLVSGLVHPGYKWDFCGGKSSTYNWGDN